MGPRTMPLDNPLNDAARQLEAGPLQGIRILDFTRVLSGPLCTQSLGDLGADIIKVEAIDVGDETRGYPPIEREGFGTVFLSVNRNKRSIAIDLKSPEGRTLVQKLARNCDVVVENFSTGVAERLGIGFDELKALNEGLIYCSISGYGRTGPLKDFGGYDPLLQAFSGMMSVTGEPDGKHIRIPISPIDQLAGWSALSAILAALIRRMSTGRGARVEISLLESATVMLNTILQSYWNRGIQPPKNGSTNEAMCPYEVFEASDGPLFLGVANNNIWRKFCAAIGLQEDPRFATNAGRVAHRSEISAIVRPIIAAHSVAEWVAKLAPAVPVAPVNTLQGMLDHPQTKACNIILEYELESGERVKGVGTPFIFDREPRSVSRPPPALGAHSEEILREIGFDEAEIENLIARRIVSSASR